MKMNAQKDSKEKRIEKKPSRDGEKMIKVKSEGATAGLAVFDYSNAHRLDARQFNEAVRQLIDYSAINYGRVSEVLEFDREADFTSLTPIAPDVLVRRFNKKKYEFENLKAQAEEDAVAAVNASTSTANPNAQAASLVEKRKEQAALKNLVGESETIALLELQLDVAKDTYKKNLLELEKVKNTYEEDKRKMYGVLYGQLTNSMRHRIQEEGTFATIQAKKDLLELWRLVKKVSLQERGTTVPNDIKRMEDARIILSRIRQFNGESLGDFYDRFLTEIGAFEAAGGTFTPRKDEELAMMFVHKLDRKRFGYILTEWENRMSDGQNVYPKTVAEALRRIGSRKSEGRAEGIAGQGIAFAAQGSTAGKQPASIGFKCFFCDLPGHKKKDCPLLQKAYQMFEADTKKQANPANANTGKCNVTIGTFEEVCEEGVGFVITNDVDEVTYSSAVLSNNEDLDNFDILCDNQSTVNLIKEQRLIKNIRVKRFWHQWTEVVC